MTGSKILVTGAAGFIGSNFLKRICVPDNGNQYIIGDCLTYAGCYETIKDDVENNSHILFENVDIRDRDKVQELFEKHQFNGVVHFAAESHVDRSIDNPNIFIETNVIGTLNLLNSSAKRLKKDSNFKFLHVSTDEVYGELTESEPAFSETTPISPNSPYSASKASSDLLALSFHHTYGLPLLLTRCSNNYGPYQFPEKLIPLMINNARLEKGLPVYGDGQNIRDWIHVHDHVDAIQQVWEKGKIGNVYNIGGNSEVKNIDVVKEILNCMGKSEDLIEYVTDRLGHDRRYAINNSKIEEELDWKPMVDFESGLRSTVEWYLSNKEWLETVSKRH